MRNAKLWAGLAAGCLILAGCACLVLLGAAGAGWYYVRRTGRLASPTPRPTRDPNATPQPAPTPNAATLAEMDAINTWVINRRGLQPTSAGVTRKFLSPEELLARTRQDFEKNTTPADVKDEERTYAVLGLMPSGLDLYRLYIRLYSEGVAGMYDPDTGELIVVSEAGQLNPYERTTYAHEYNHALQDQNYHIRAMGFSDEGWKADAEKAAAVQALLEGDATLLEEQYKATLSLTDQMEYDRIINGMDVSVYSEVPAFLLQSFFFPYDQGRNFVAHFYDAGGWARVDEVWKNPPTSTEQILHPDRYEAGDNPLPVPRPALTDTLGAGWRELDSNAFGEWSTYLVLAYGDDPAYRLSDSQAQAAAAGWGGDAYTVFYNEAQSQTVLGLHTQWGTVGDAQEFQTTFMEYADKRFARRVAYPGGQCWEGPELHCFFSQGAHTLWLAAPDKATITQLLTAYPDLKQP